MEPTFRARAGDSFPPLAGESHIRYFFAGRPHAVKNNCGIVTCSVYFSKDLTRDIVVPAKAVSVVSRKVPRIGPVVSRMAGAVSSKAAEAARTNGCLRIRYTRSGTIVGLYADHNGAYCRDN